MKISPNMMRAYYLLQKYAQLATVRAIRDGKLAALVVDRKPTGIPCVDCGKPATEYEHRDYVDMLRVEPTCRRCNSLRGPAVDTFRWFGMAEEKIEELKKGGRMAIAKSKKNQQ